ncbi:MAG: hypothetical protein IPK71_08055 [Myxococcales bacterium]|nr:hypothetical protein [Myxococcales bacterium]
MSNKEDEAAVKKDMDELHKFAKSITMDAVNDGNWFHTLLHHSLDSYGKKVNAGYFREKYPGIPADGIVDLRIKLASNYSAIEGFLTSSAYSAAVAATIGSGAGRHLLQSQEPSQASRWTYSSPPKFSSASRTT